MAGSSPESGEFAARHHLSLGFAVTTLPLAAKASRYYREQAAGCGWEPTPDDVLYRLTVHVADTDEAAREDLLAAGGAEQRTGVPISNPAIKKPAARLCYTLPAVQHQDRPLRAQSA